jgi:hypothetical protein
MDPEVAKARRLAGIKRRQRQTERNVQYIFDNCPEGCSTPYQFLRTYESMFGKLDFIYARAHTEFGEQFGRDVSPEEAGWGIYRPVNEEGQESLERLVDRVDKAMEKIPPDWKPE